MTLMSGCYVEFVSTQSAAAALPSMTNKVRALSAVAHHLGTDLTAERGRRDNGGDDALSFQWRGFRGGDHLVESDGRVWAVDLVLGAVASC